MYDFYEHKSLKTNALLPPEFNRQSIDSNQLITLVKGSGK